LVKFVRPRAFKAKGFPWVIWEGFKALRKLKARAKKGLTRVWQNSLFWGSLFWHLFLTFDQNSYLRGIKRRVGDKRLMGFEGIVKRIIWELEEPTKD